MPRLPRAAAARLGRVSLGRRTGHDHLALQSHGRSAPARTGPHIESPGRGLARALRDVCVHREDIEQAARLRRRAKLPDTGMRAHGVNVAMALKTSALWSLISGEAADRDAAGQALKVLDRHHGQPNGMFSADEHHCRAGSVAGHGAVRGGRVALFAPAGRRRQRRRGAGRSHRADGLQRDAGDDVGRHVVASIRPAGQPGDVQPEPPPLGEQRTGVEPLRPRAQLRLLHGQPAPGLAQAGGRACGWPHPTTAWRPSSMRRAP